MKVYSPSQTILFMECPYKWLLKKIQGYITKAVQKKDVAAAAGNAYGKVMNAAHNPNVAYSEKILQDYVVTEFELEVSITRGKDRSVDENILLEIESFKKLLPKMVKKYLNSDERIPESWKVTHIEHDLQDGAGSRIDLGGINELGQPFFWDWKLKTNCPIASKDFTLNKFAHDWQMMHYAWAYSEYLDELVERFYIGMPVAKPAVHFWSKPYTVSEKQIRAWTQDARYWWEKMQEAEDLLSHGLTEVNPVPRSNNHFTYGRCEYYGLCLEEGQDHLYIQKGKS